MGEVYRAMDSVLERKVAVKLLSERHASEPEVRARFRREALAAARLSGTPHVITVFDVGEHEEQPYIVMEYLDGGSVHDRLREGRVPPGQALEWLAQAGQALDRAHAEGVVHRDVKPANLLLDRDGAICVTDFGIASTTGVDTLTLPGTVLGTAGYLSPEQARGEPATAASDRYGLGVVAFELLTGRRPYEGDTAATEAFAHVNAPVPSAEQIHPELPDGVDEVLARALAKDPEDRPATCAELVADLRDAFRGAVAPTRIAPAAVAATGAPHAPDARPAPTRAVASCARPRRRRLPRRGADPRGAPGRDPRPRRAEEAGRAELHDDDQTTQTTQRETTVEVDPADLNDAGYAFMQDGDFQRARPLLEKAVRALQGSGTLPEAWASYNLAYTRYALGSCDVFALLDRSEAVQGEKPDIDRLYADAYETCVSGDSGGDDD